MEQHNFPIHEQKTVIKVLLYALYKQQYPDDLCGIMKKLQFLEQANTEMSEKNGTKRTQKVTTDVLMSLLQQAGISAASDDKAKMARLIAYLTDFSEEKIRQRLSNTEELTSYHKDEIENINKILTELNSNISIKYNNKR